MLSSAFHADLLDLAHVVAPEINQPLYVVQHPAHLPMPDQTSGYALTSTTMNPLWKDHLQALGEWEGPGPVIVLNTGKYARDTDGNRSAVAGVFLHELAHHLPFIQRRDVEAHDVLRDFHMANLRTWAATDNEPTDKPAWHPGHGADFARIACHLHFRAVWHQHRIGRHLDLELLHFAGEHYDMSPPSWYRRALGDEPADVLDQPFAVIAATPPPAEFTQLWEADKRHFDQLKGNR